MNTYEEKDYLDTEMNDRIVYSHMIYPEESREDISANLMDYYERPKKWHIFPEYVYDDDFDDSYSIEDGSISNYDPLTEEEFEEYCLNH